MKIMKSSPKNSCPSVGELDLELLDLLLALRVGLWLRLSSGTGCASCGSRCTRSARITATGFSGPGPSRALPGTDAGPSWARSRSMGSSQSMVRNATFDRIIQLVGGFNLPLWKMMEFVSWDDEIPKIWKNKKWSKPPTRQYSTWFNRIQHCLTIWVRFWCIEPLILAHEKLMTWCYCWSITVPLFSSPASFFVRLLRSMEYAWCCLRLLLFPDFASGYHIVLNKYIKTHWSESAFHLSEDTVGPDGCTLTAMWWTYYPDSWYGPPSSLQCFCALWFEIRHQLLVIYEWSKEWLGSIPVLCVRFRATFI